MTENRPPTIVDPKVTVEHRLCADQSRHAPHFMYWRDVINNVRVDCTGYPPPPGTTLADIELVVDSPGDAPFLHCMPCGATMAFGQGAYVALSELIEEANKHLRVCPGPVEETT